MAPSHLTRADRMPHDHDRIPDGIEDLLMRLHRSAGTILLRVCQNALHIQIRSLLLRVRGNEAMSFVMTLVKQETAVKEAC